MELARLLEGLSSPRAYSCAAGQVTVRQTHISAVFLVGPWAYKIKKPVKLGFLDFSTLDRRRHFCAEEIRLNARLAPGVYQGVVPVSMLPSGITMEGEGEVIEWAVKMKRLPEQATFQAYLERGELGKEHVRELARRIAAFHAGAEQGEHISRLGRFEIVAGNARDNFAQAEPLIGATISRAVFDQLRSCNEAALSRLRGLIVDRCKRGMPRDTHGDLRLDHVYYFPEIPPPDNLVIIDCIEFNHRFRYADPVSDIAFPCMELLFQRRRDLAREFQLEYFAHTQDPDGRLLLPFYTVYRAAVRGKVEGLELLEQEVPLAERQAALARARAHWLMALGELETPGRRPCLVLIGGLPGTGKSTLASELVKRAHLTLIRSDVVRKEIAGVPAGHQARARYEQVLYAPEWTEKTYSQCLERAERLLFEGRRVVVDASFSKRKNRAKFLAMAEQLAIPAILLECEAEPDVVRQRLEQRQQDSSDADWQIHQQLSKHWEPISPVEAGSVRTISTAAPTDRVLAKALCQLRELSVLD